MKKRDFVVRFAGEGGQGVVTSAEGLAQAAAQVGYHVQTFATFPSQIKGGPTWTQTRLSSTVVLSSGDELDVLVAFNEDAYQSHKQEMAPGGVVIYNSAEFTITDEGTSFGMDFAELAKATGNPRSANFVVMGSLSRLVDMPIGVFEDFNLKRYTRGRPTDKQIIDSNNAALHLGWEEAEKSGLSLGALTDPVKPEYEQILVNGNITIGLGAMACWS